MFLVAGCECGHGNLCSNPGELPAGPIEQGSSHGSDLAGAHKILLIGSWSFRVAICLVW